MQRRLCSASTYSEAILVLCARCLTSHNAHMKLFGSLVLSLVNATWSNVDCSGNTDTVTLMSAVIVLMLL